MAVNLAGRLTGKVAVVTGTSPNIGGTIASGFAAAGAKVVCNDLRPAVAEARAEAIRAAGGEAIAVAGDITDPALVGELVTLAVQRWDRIDVLVNNAVRFNTKGVLDMPVEEFRQQVDIIIGGAFLMTQSVARSMIERQVHGSIINVLSTAAWQGQAGNIGYCTAKSGMINFTRSAAMELAPHGILVNAVAPGPTQVERTAHGPAQRDAFMRRMAIKRYGNPSDIAAAAAYLASDDAGFVTGHVLNVDGGFHAAGVLFEAGEKL